MRGRREGESSDVVAGGVTWPVLLRLVPLLTVSVVLLDTAVPVLPNDAVVAKLTLGRLLIAIGLVTLVASGARWRDFRSWLDLPIGLLVLVGVATTVRGGYDGSALRALLTAVASYYLVVGVVRRDRGAWRALSLVAFVAVVVAGVVAVSQFAQDTPTGFCRSAALRDVPCGPDAFSRSIGTFDNPNLLAAFVVLLGPFAVLFALRNLARGERVVALGVVGIAYLGLLVSFSRMGLVAAAAGAVVAAALLLVRARGWRRSAPLLALPLAGLAGIVVLVSAASGIRRAFGVRNEAWGLAVDAGNSRPVLGVGIDRAGDVMNSLGQPQIEFFHAHNLWLNWYAETGVPGLLAVVAITVIGLFVAARAAVDGSPLAAAGLVGLVGFFLMGLTDHPSALDRLATAWWVCLGMVMAHQRVGALEVSEPSSPVARTPGGRGGEEQQPGGRARVLRSGR